MDMSPSPSGKRASLSSTSSSGGNSHSSLVVNNNQDSLIEMNLVRRESKSSSTLTSISNPQVEVIWRNFSYRLPEQWTHLVARKFRGNSTSGEKNILKSQSGKITGGTITGLMGPSGAGKTTLLNCITNRIRDGVRGDVWVRVPSKDKIRIGFVPQSDSLLPQFTVRESLLFASRMNNTGLTKKEHMEKVSDILRAFNLDQCADNQIPQLSGGQQKRLSIGVEFISKPEVLMLDEPTSGLDAHNSLTVVKLLKDLTQRQTLGFSPAIIFTIHQPSVEAFMLFDQVYLINSEGESLYWGAPQLLIPFLSKHGCHGEGAENPADYALEVANGKHGKDVYPAMIEANQEQWSDQVVHYRDKYIPMNRMRGDRQSSFLFQVWAVFLRNLSGNMIKSVTMLFRICLGLFLAIFICTLMQDHLGEPSGCWTDTMNIFNVGPDTGNGTKSLRKQIDQLVKDPTALTRYKDEFSHRLVQVTANSMFIFIQTTYLMILYSVGTVLVMPLEMNTVSREIANSWYSVESYFLAKTVADAIFCIVSSFPFMTYMYYFSGQPHDWWRYGMWILISTIFAQVNEAKGTLLGVFFCDNVIIAVLIAVSVMSPVVMFSGVMIRVSLMHPLFRPLAYLSDLKYAFSAILVVLYGHGRCGPTVTTQLNPTSTMSFVSSLWASLKVTNADVRDLCIFLGLDPNYLDPVIEAMDNYFLDGEDEVGGAPVPSVNGTLSDSPDYIGDEASNPVPVYEVSGNESSFVLSFFGVKESELSTCIINLILMYVTYRSLCYVFLRRRIQNCRL